MKFNNAVSFVHSVLRDRLYPGAIVIDATIGNGWDTALMATLTGDRGVVYGFDVQPIALEVTRTRIAGTAATVHLVLAGHEEMRAHLDPDHIGAISAVTFNLGYLPGGDKDVTTTAHTTRVALEQARAILAPDGVITVVCYRHAEGERELSEVRDLLATWPQQELVCTEIQFVNQAGNPPVVFLVQRVTNENSSHSFTPHDRPINDLSI